MKIRFTVLSFSIAFLLTSSCNLICVDGTGPVVNTARNSETFTKLELDMDAEVEIVKGSAPVEIIAQDNITSEIETDFSGKTLRIRSKRCLNHDEPIKIKLSMNDIELLEISGSGTITIPDTMMVDKISLELNGSGKINAKLIAATLKADISGSGDIDLSGSANKINAQINGSGDIRAAAMPCNTADIEINGSGNFQTYVLQDLKALVNGSGDVKYKGTPKVKSEINGSGKVNSMN